MCFSLPLPIFSCLWNKSAPFTVLPPPPFFLLPFSAEVFKWSLHSHLLADNGDLERPRKKSKPVFVSPLSQ